MKALNESIEAVEGAIKSPRSPRSPRILSKQNQFVKKVGDSGYNTRRNKVIRRHVPVQMKFGI